MPASWSSEAVLGHRFPPVCGLRLRGRAGLAGRKLHSGRQPAESCVGWKQTQVGVSSRRDEQFILQEGHMPTEYTKLMIVPPSLPCPAQRRRVALVRAERGLPCHQPAVGQGREVARQENLGGKVRKSCLVKKAAGLTGRGVLRTLSPEKFAGPQLRQAAETS